MGRQKTGETLRSLEGFPIDEATRTAIMRAVQAFDAWVTQNWAPTAEERELPFVGLDEHGTMVNAVIDLVVETEQGIWVVDHKSDQTDDLAGRFSHYLPQLHAYAETVRHAQPG